MKNNDKKGDRINSILTKNFLIKTNNIFVEIFTLILSSILLNISKSFKSFVKAIIFLTSYLSIKFFIFRCKSKESLYSEYGKNSL